MEMVRVNSSAISAVGYDENSRRMKIRFKQGDTYDFCRVPSNIFQGLLSARSKGTYYNDHIRDKYQTLKFMNKSQ
jgi:KTSC domain